MSIRKEVRARAKRFIIVGRLVVAVGTYLLLVVCAKMAYVPHPLPPFAHLNELLNFPIAAWYGFDPFMRALWRPMPRFPLTTPYDVGKFLAVVGVFIAGVGIRGHGYRLRQDIAESDRRKYERALDDDEEPKER